LACSARLEPHRRPFVSGAREAAAPFGREPGTPPRNFRLAS
jgi:hypothetical protein